MSKIPKIIHYCWFGGNQLPPIVSKCIESWKKYCPDYELKEWNESNFDINCNAYVQEAYKAKKWAFVSDVARLYSVYTDGGIYLDTDVELIKPIDDLLNDSMFMGWEDYSHVNTGHGFGAEKGFYLVKKMLDIYDELIFLNPNGTYNLTACPIYNTRVIKREGFILNNTKQTINNITVYPTEYFCPIERKTAILRITKNTYAIHHYDNSWMTDEQKKESKIVAEYRQRYGKKLGGILYVLIGVCSLRKYVITKTIEKIEKAVRGEL